MAYDVRKPDWWTDALNGKEPPIHADQPMYGFYAYRRRKEDPYVPVAFWYNGDGELKCKIGDASVRYGIDVWPNAARNPISYEIYKAVIGGEPWPNEVRFTDSTGKTRSTQEDGDRGKIGDNSRAVNQVLDDIVEWTSQATRAKKKGNPTTKEEADALADISTKIGELCKDAENERLELTRPLLDKQREIKARYDRIINPAKAAIFDLKASVNSYLSIERQRREDEAKKLREQAQEAGVDVKVEATAPRVGTRGKSVSQVTVSTVVIEDMKAVAAYFAGMKEPPADFVEAMKRNAYRILHAGAEVPGARMEKSKQAR